MAISIDNINNTQVNNSGKSNQTTSVNKDGSKAAVNNESTSSIDTISLTDSAKLIQQLEKQLVAQPVVNAEKVSEVRQNINSGNYIISSERVAEKFTLYESYLQAAS